jgi:hypothetical protein
MEENMNIGDPVREFVIEPLNEPIPKAPLVDPSTAEVPREHHTGQD